MVHNINTPTKYSAIHGNGNGLFGSYTRSIPKTSINNPSSTQNNRIRINDFGSKKGHPKGSAKLCKKNHEKRSIRDGSPELQDGYQHNPHDHREANKANKAGSNSYGQKSKNFELRVRSASNSKKYRYSDKNGQNRDQSKSSPPFIKSDEFLYRI